MRHPLLTTIIAAIVMLLVPALAQADATLFIGANTSPVNRTAKGFAIGAGLLVIGFEFEYSDTTNDVNAGAPSLKTGTGNLLLQSPIAFAGFQPYFEVGGGIYHEELNTISNTGFVGGTGGGLKISLIGPIRLRVDYRAFTLRNGALTTPAHRVYAGVNLKF
jgi:hypothetical protein